VVFVPVFFVVVMKLVSKRHGKTGTPETPLAAQEST
jgi:hypothetical protein